MNANVILFCIAFTAKAALVGTMRHALFEKCLLHNNFTMEFARNEASHIVRDHGDQLIGGGLLNEKHITSEVVKMLPNIRRFAATYTNFTTNNCCGKLVGEGISPDVEVMVNKVHGTEEFAISSELGIKGFIDASVEVTTKSPNGIQGYMKNRFTAKSLMGIELKTGHSQTPRPAHMAQLALYTLALRTRYGSIPSKNKTLGDDLDGASYGGMLLYLNQESLNAVHVAPSIDELKTLLSQRNDISSDLKRAAAPRGVSIEYDTKSEEKGEKRYFITHACLFQLSRVPTHTMFQTGLPFTQRLRLFYLTCCTQLFHVSAATQIANVCLMRRSKISFCLELLILKGHIRHFCNILLAI